MANQFQCLCVIATVTMKAMCLQAIVGFIVTFVPQTLFRQIYYAWASRLELWKTDRCLLKSLAGRKKLAVFAVPSQAAPLHGSQTLILQNGLFYLKLYSMFTWLHC